jgi:pSer/pThr/pTyr-binding forkhead associated (FHA) protein
LIALQEVNGSYIVTGTNYPLLKLTSLGRSPTNTITIDDTFASSDHAFVALRSGQWWLEDRQSRNGTTLNEVPITQPVIITDGDIIGIGRNRFRLELEQD